ncbi:hypothetical protein Poli38472_009619 [Pythium oligandrum]|uniref:ABC transporter domain-containing protein n=1 Tax=Pythium oligandrum TaxID=41045 RepID=A0A8K1CFY7_PYTOL|nr:hypothetical protein Poli38472_009619 [Pythium oligandrum]|eukprot:TMW62126.1 hypothetical protein Poli38472_009619 [Pythium oligandrum]
MATMTRRFGVTPRVLRASRRASTQSIRFSVASRFHSSSAHPRRPHIRDDPSDSVESTEGPKTPLLTVPPAYTLHDNEIHCFLGVNGSGKSKLLQRIQDVAAAMPRSSQSPRVGTLSFEAHRAFVGEHGDRVVAEVLGGVGSPTARDLIVRLGLYPVWESKVRHLSTGEVRKVMLAVALLKVPRSTVLIMDQPFDGLDVAARKQLEWMLGQLTRGFTRLLVDFGGRNEAFAYKTQVLLVANRLEQVFPEILTHVVLKRKDNESLESEKKEDAVEIVQWEDPEKPESMLARLRAFFENEATQHGTELAEEDVKTLVRRLYSSKAEPSSDGASTRQIAIELHEVSIAYGRRLLLEDVVFKRHRHEHWALLGPNGSGKSSLMRVLTQSDGHGQVGGTVRVHGERIAVVSTDQHLEMLSRPEWKDRTALDWLQLNAQDSERVEVVTELLGISSNLLPRRFNELSQGEQKLIQIASALVGRPDVLILDEITHGLDMWNRARVLQVINAVGVEASTQTHLILITHHEDEIVECFQSVFEIQDQSLVERER